MEKKIEIIICYFKAVMLSSILYLNKNSTVRCFRRRWRKTLHESLWSCLQKWNFFFFSSG